MQLRRFLDGLLRSEPNRARLAARDPGVITIVSVVYSTAPKTFTGDAVFVTMTSAQPTTAQAQTTAPLNANPAKSSSTEEDGDSSPPAPTTTAKSTAPAAVASSSASRSASSSSSAASSTIAPATTSQASTVKAASSAAVSASSSSSSTPTAAPASSAGMSGGAKAGLAFGLIILFALLGAGIFALYKKRKRDMQEYQGFDDEKRFLAAGRNPDSLPSHASPETNRTRAGTNATVATNGTYENPFHEKPMPAAPAEDSASQRARFSYEQPAPRLSLRAVSQFEPSLPGDVSRPVNPADAPSLPPNAAGNVAAASAAAAGAVGVAAAAVAAANAKSIANDPSNPFGNHAEKLSSSPPQTSNLPAPATKPTGRVSPVVQAADFPLPESNPATPVTGKFPGGKEGVVAAGAGAAGAAAIAAATAAAASNKPQGAAPSPGGPQADNVHRVHMDFMPSPNMEDELEIHAGQLVRVLFEYDDGWALCIRMDRSAQGVVPRTCLSKHPIKPRPSSPNGRPGPRGPPPGMRGPGGPPPFAQPPRPHSPASGRNSPGPYGNNGRNSPGPRAMSPGPFANAPRPLTPTQAGRARSNSNAPTYGAYNPANRSQSPGPYGGSRLRPQENAQSRRRSNSMSQVTNLRKEAGDTTSKIPSPAGVVPSRKPVPGQAV